MQMHSQDPNYRRHPHGTVVPKRGKVSMALPPRLHAEPGKVSTRTVKATGRRQGFPWHLVSQ